MSELKVNARKRLKCQFYTQQHFSNREIMVNNLRHRWGILEHKPYGVVGPQYNYVITSTQPTHNKTEHFIALHGEIKLNLSISFWFMKKITWCYPWEWRKFCFHRAVLLESPLLGCVGCWAVRTWRMLREKAVLRGSGLDCVNGMCATKTRFSFSPSIFLAQNKHYEDSGTLFQRSTST